jgi:hypothetical protein
VLHGREPELELLRARLAAAREGRSFAVALTGEAGIGKTALLVELLEEADGFRVLRGRGFESEAEIPYAGLLALVRPLLDLADRLPEQQSAALRSALALGPPTPQDRFAVPVAVLALLGAAADEQPLLVAVDDAHWLDPATREALFFAGTAPGGRGRRGPAVGPRDRRRARHRPRRPRAPGARRARRERRAVAAGRRRRAVGRRRAGPATGGNPLALLELTPVLSEPERRGLRPIRTPLPTGERVEEIFSRQVAELPRPRGARSASPRARRAGLDELFAALGRMGLSEDDLGPAEAPVSSRSAARG